ncbi:MAG: hypothetical protein ACK4Y5_16735 [Acetobacteraceae bacterium]
MEQSNPPALVRLSEGLGPLPWGDIEAWLEVSDASQIASDIRAYADAEVARAVAAERERCAQIVETYPVPVGNSAAGEMAAEWTMDALREVRDAIRGA